MAGDDGLVKAVLERAQEEDGSKRLSCAEAFALARKFKTGTREIGRICNEQNIKIVNCQLGCFP